MVHWWIEPCIAWQWVAQWGPWGQAITVIGEGGTEKKEVVVVVEEEGGHNRWYDDDDEEEEEDKEEKGGAKNISTNSYIAPTSTIVPPLF